MDILQNEVCTATTIGSVRGGQSDLPSLILPLGGHRSSITGDTFEM